MNNTMEEIESNRYLTPCEFGRFSATQKPRLSCLHFNAQSARNKKDVISTFLESLHFQFDVIFITETWYKHDYEVLRMPEYTSFFLNRPAKGGGGILLLSRCELECQLLEAFSLTTEHYEVLSVRCDASVFCVAYRPPCRNVTNFFLFLMGIWVG